MHELTLDYFLYGFAGAAIISLVAMRLKALTFSGVIGAIIIGTLVFGFDTVSRGASLIYFFISASILSAIKSKRKNEAMQFSEKTGPRDFRQVLANGGLGALAIIMAQIRIEPYYETTIAGYMAYIVLLSVATADTWATEIGTLSPEKTRKLFSFEKVHPGESGGITIIGSIAAFIGSTSVPVVAWLVTYPDPDFRYIGGFFNNLDAFLAIGIIGLFGALIDSFLGSHYQAHYYCESCQRLTENKTHCGKNAELMHGIAWINNDVVNFLSQAVIFILLFILIVS